MANDASNASVARIIKEMKAGKLPDGLTLAELLNQGNLTATDVANIIWQSHCGGYAEFCEIPVRFAGCELAYDTSISIETADQDKLDELLRNPPKVIVDPSDTQRIGIELCKLYLDGNRLVCSNGNTFAPNIGFNFYGMPGCGKTHIMAAFAMACHKKLAKQLESYKSLILAEVKKMIQAYHDAAEKHKGKLDERHVVYEISDDLNKIGTDHTNKAPHEIIDFYLAEINQKTSRMQFKPTDLIYISFDVLCEICSKDEKEGERLLGILTTAKLVFIDDVHPKSDDTRAQLIQTLVERRYDSRLAGIFMTTNLEASKIGGEDAQISERLVSRLSEMVVTLNFKDSRDWRKKVAARRSEIVLTYLKEEIAKQK